MDLPKKHGRGGQSALRFARLRMEKRHNYVRKVAETAVQCFIKDDKVTCANIILAGSADFKTELNGSDMFDQRLQVRQWDIFFGFLGYVFYVENIVTFISGVLEHLLRRAIAYSNQRKTVLQSFNIFCVGGPSQKLVSDWSGSTNV